MAKEVKSTENLLRFTTVESELKYTPWWAIKLPTGQSIRTQIKYYQKYSMDIRDNINPLDLPQIEIGKIFEDQLKSSLQLSLDSLSDDELFALIEVDQSIIAKARSLEILIARDCENPFLAALVYQELIKDKLPISWRNTLLLAIEHIQIKEPNLRRELSAFLLKLCPNIKDETHPRSLSASAAAVRTLPTLLDDANQTVQLLKFLSTDYSIKTRHIALFGIRSMASLPTPGNIPEKIVTEIGNELVYCARYHLRHSACSTSEEEFDLGLDIIDTLIVLGYNAVPSLICELETLRMKWVIDHLNDTLSNAIIMWETRAPSFHKAKQNLITAIRKAVDSIALSS